MPSPFVSNRNRRPYQTGEILLTRLGLHKLGISNPELALDTKITCSEGQVEMTVIGIADAYPPLMKSPDMNVEFREPDFLHFNPDVHTVINAKYQGVTLDELTEQASQVLEEMSPGARLNVQSLKRQKEQMFKAMFTMLWSVGGFGLLAVLIALLGLYAMSVFTVERRTKEIGIRKTLGAPVKSIIFDLVWDTCKPVLIALAISAPLAYLGGRLALQFFYTVPPILWISFGLVPAILVSIAVGSILWHSYSAATTNPVNALRYE